LFNLHTHSIGVIGFGAVTTYVLLRWLLTIPSIAQLLAKPNHRSLHTQPTPNIGGIVFIPIMAGMAYAMTKTFPLCAGSALVLACLGAIDDRRPLPAGLRLPFHFAVSAVAVFQIMNLSTLAVDFHWVTIGMSLLLILIFAWAINLFNFMDGSDGIATVMALVGFGFYSLVAGSTWVGLVSLCMFSCLLGFIWLNWHPAKTFMGDAGSTTLGFCAAALGTAGWQEGLWSWIFPCSVFSPFWVDATYTLCRRVLRTERFWEGHKSHLYQRLIQQGCSAKLVALGYGLVGSLAAMSALYAKPIIGIISQTVQPIDNWVNVSFLVALLCCYLVSVLLIERTLTKLGHSSH
jgi:UDP-N-acetylmuramyl pentapeptide phosphotransferase/UDP-N-acetylglucosamine-1-phosphate transferase